LPQWELRFAPSRGIVSDTSPACTNVQKKGQLSDPTLLYFDALSRAALLFTIASVAKSQNFAAEAVMKAVLALVIIYVAMFFLAIQGASQNSAQTARNGASQAAHSIDPIKEADIRSLIELVGARDAMQDFATHGADQLRENLVTSVPDNDRGQQFVNAFIDGYKAKFNADEATAQLVTIYDQHFTQDEIKGLLQFYGSPLGQKFAAEMPKINSEMQGANRAFSTRIAKEVLQDLHKQYPSLAAHARFAKPHPGQLEQAHQQAQAQP
jgi:hypothetical protein